MTGAAQPALPVPPRRILPVIVLSQVAGTSLWFAVNAVMPDLQRQWSLPDEALGWLTSIGQAGFVAGSLLLALTRLPDRMSPSLLFLLCAMSGALANAAAVLLDGSGSGTGQGGASDTALTALLALRFVVGACLAGIYPVGMKIASGWYRQGLGAALGLLVGALVLGTALPHLVRAVGIHWPWQQVMIAVSLVTLAGGLLLYLLVPDAAEPRLGAAVDPRALIVIVRDPVLRASVFGYFGHMWELYAMLVMVPLLISSYLHSDVTAGVSMLSFVVVAVGALGCVAGGYAALRIGSARVATWQLAVSGLCCLAAPWMSQMPPWLFFGWIIVWGITVVGDSPQFSTLTARNAPPALVGSVLTFVNCIGFSISIVSIQLVVQAASWWPPERVMPVLALGSLLGVLAMRPLLRRPRAA